MKNRVDIKNIVAVTIIIASFLIAIGLALVSNQQSSYWVAATDLTPGHLVLRGDFKESKASIGRGASGYLQTDTNPEGYSITKSISAGEFLHQSALLEATGIASNKLLSFAVTAADLPSGAKVGDSVNLYQVINDNGDGTDQPSTLIIESVYIVDLNRRAENIAGASIVTVAIPDEFVERTLNATRKGRMVVVTNHG